MNETTRVIVGLGVLSLLLISTGLYWYPDNLHPEQEAKKQVWLKLFGLKPVDGKIHIPQFLWLSSGWYLAVAVIATLVFGKQVGLTMYYMGMGIGVAVMVFCMIVYFFHHLFHKKE